MSDATTEQATEPKDDLMGYEGQIDAPKAEEVVLPTASADTQSIINKAVKEVTVDDNGKYVYPENMDPMLKAAVAATKSYRDNQSGFTKGQQKLKELEAEGTVLREQLAKFTSKSLELTPEQAANLNELKTSNPDEWRKQLNNLEQVSKASIQEELDEVTEEVRSKAGAEFELQRRYDYLDSFNEGREVKITPELLDSDIPPRITKKLAEGEITFEGYLDEVSDYLDKGKVVAKSSAEQTTDLNKANGSTTPSEEAQEKQAELDYSQMTL